MKKIAFFYLLVILIVIIGFTIPTPISAAEYIVQDGDNLTNIAEQFNVSIESIIENNTIADPSLIVVGQVLEIPEEPEHNLSESSFFVPTEKLLVADFDNCTSITNSGGLIGGAYQKPNNSLNESYILRTDWGCAAKFEYEIKDWGAFWMKLQKMDLTDYGESGGMLTFDIKADEPIPYVIKIELKRFCSPEGSCGELSVYHLTGITSEWQTRNVPLDGFGTTGWAATLSSWEELEELVFTVETPGSGNNGTIYLDNINFVR